MGRVERLLDELDAKGLGLMLVHDNSDLFWLTGMHGVFDEEQAHFALVGRDMLALHTDSRYINAFLACKDADGRWEFTTQPRKLSDFVAQRLSSLGCASPRIGFEGELAYITYSKLIDALSRLQTNAELVVQDGLIRRLRASKDSCEIEALRAAQRITDSAFSHILGVIRPGMTESQVALELEFFMRGEGAQGLAFPSIVAAGENGASPHSTPGQRVLERGDMVVMDFGAKVAGYCSDMTRTVCLGRASERQREAYGIVLQAQTEAKAAIRAGKRGSEIHDMAASVIDASPFAGLFGHSLGHGVGIDVHESPNLSPSSDMILVSGNVVTVEPGVYLQGEFGIRIEDFGVVTDNGFETFTASTHELIEV